jgi:acylphosphatase
VTERFIIHGQVQGVGYRAWTVATVERLARQGKTLRGWVRNRRDGTVEVLAIGFPNAINALAEACAEGPDSARVVLVRRSAAEDDGAAGFTQVPTV